MKEHPILFSSEMVRAILDGKKTQTRRVIKPQPYAIIDHQPYVDNPVKVVDEATGRTKKIYSDANMNRFIKVVRCPYGQPGDRLWVRETWAYHSEMGVGEGHKIGISYKASGYKLFDRPVEGLAFENFRGGFDNWRPSIHMPRWASRITLEVVSVRAERVQEITKEDAKAEGMYCGFVGGEYDFNIGPYDAYTANFRKTWDSINAKRGYSWASNPWVWAIEFKVVRNA